MTIICAVQDPITHEIHYGADHLCRFGEDAYRSKIEKKWADLGQRYAWMTCGYWRMTQILQSAPEFKDGIDAMPPFQLTEFVRKTLPGYGYSAKKDANDIPVEHYDHTSILIDKVERDIWLVACDFSLSGIPPGEFIAAGSGRPEAIGAAFAVRLYAPGEWKEMVETAIAAAIEYDTGCGEPVSIGWVAGS